LMHSCPNRAIGAISLIRRTLSAAFVAVSAMPSDALIGQLGEL